MAALTCYHNGCDKTFTEETNTDDACVYHPGSTVFHDGMKGWSCCAKRVVGFQEFLELEGCTVGRHSNVKAPKDEKLPAVPSNGVADQVTAAATKRVVPTSAERCEDAHVEVPCTASKTAVAAWEQCLADAEAEKANDDGTTKPGTPCVRKGCNATYVDASSDTETCRYHDGEPVFHEGMKSWSCCKHRTADFQAFLEQEGCTEGTHAWKGSAASGGERIVAQCRNDFFQSAKSITLNIYAKKVNPNEVKITANATTLSVSFPFGTDSRYERTFNLWGAIDPAACKAFLGVKLELTLPKAVEGGWDSLEV